MWVETCENCGDKDYDTYRVDGMNVCGACRDVTPEKRKERAKRKAMNEYWDSYEPDFPEE